MRISSMSFFARDEDGAVAVIVALLLVVLLGFTALGVDVASLYRDRARLQSFSDLTAVSAMAAPSIANDRANYVMSRNNVPAEALETLQTGRFLRNPAIAPQNRFSALPAGNTGVNAVRVELKDDAALHFARVFSDKTHVTIGRTALATRTGGASFALDSHIINLSGAELNRLLGERFGLSATISVGDLNVLAETTVNVGDLLDSLAALIGSTSANPAEILNATTSVDDLIAALQSNLPAGLAASLSGLRSGAGSATFDVAALIGGIDTELGLTVTDFLAEVEISALDVVRALVNAQPAGNGIALDANINALGVVSAQTSIVAGEPPAQSGWISMGEEGVQLQRAAVRLATELEVAPNLLGNLGLGVQVASVHLPLHVEVAGSAATLEQISCDASSPENLAATFSTAATPLHPANGTSVAALYLGTVADNAGPIDPADLGFADLLTLDIVVGLLNIRIPGIVIQARSHVAVGASQTETVTFTHGNIADGLTMQTFGSGELLSSAVNGLLSPDNTELRVKPGQTGLVSGLAAPVIAGLLPLLPERLLSGLAAPVDSVLDAALQSLGVELGAGELTLTGHHCEPIRLVQ